MQKIIKLSDTHYIGVDDSEIKVGDIVAEKLLTGEYELFEIHTPNDIDEVRQKKVTHSNQPLENINFVDEAEGIITPKIKSLSLSEVEEAINGYSVKKMVERLYSRVISENEYDFRRGFEIGFNAHKELVKDKFILSEKDIYRIIDMARKDDGVDGYYHQSEIIQSLLPKTEWGVEFDEQNKLKLI